MNAREILDSIGRLEDVDLHDDVESVLPVLRALAERLAALESREEVRHRIEPIMRGEKPEKGAGR